MWLSIGDLPFCCLPTQPTTDNLNLNTTQPSPSPIPNASKNHHHSFICTFHSFFFTMAPIRPPRHGRKKQTESRAVSMSATGDSTLIPSPVPPQPEQSVSHPPKPEPLAVNPPKPDPPEFESPAPALPKAEEAKMETPKAVPPKAAILAAKYPQSGTPHSLLHSTTSRPLADPANAGPPKGNPPKTYPAHAATQSVHESTTSTPIPEPPNPDPPIDDSKYDKPCFEEEKLAFRKGFTFRGPDMSALDSTGRNPLNVEFWLGTTDAHFINMDLRPNQVPGYTMNDVDLTFRMYNRTTSEDGVTKLTDRIFHTEPDTVYCLHAERGVTYTFDNIPDPNENSSYGMPIGTSLRMIEDRLRFPKMDTPIYNTSTTLDSSSARKCRDYITPLQCDPRGTRCTYPTSSANNPTSDTSDTDCTTRSSPIQFTPSTTASNASTASTASSPRRPVPSRPLHHPALPGGPSDLAPFLAAHKAPRIFTRCGCGDLVPTGSNHCSIESGTNRLMQAVGLDLEDDYSVAKRIAMDFFVGHDEGTPIQMDGSWYKLNAHEFVRRRDQYADALRQQAETRQVRKMEDRVLTATRLEMVKVGVVREGRRRGLNEVLRGTMDFSWDNVVDGRVVGEVEGGGESAGPELDSEEWDIDMGKWRKVTGQGEEEPYFWGAFDSEEEFMEALKAQPWYKEV